MKLFIDTANIEEIENIVKRGIVTGVTTNPSLLSKEPKNDFYQHIGKIVEICRDNGDLPLSVEVFAEKPQEMYDQAIEICKKLNYDNLNIKIPIGFDELEVIQKLSSENIKVNCTCCFSTTQMQLAAQAGASYVSLFYNRLKDNGGNPEIVLQRTRDFIDKNNLECEIIAGSIRNGYDLEDCWDSGADIVTASFKTIEKSVKHLKTDESVRGFLNDFKEWIK